MLCSFAFGGAVWLGVLAAFGYVAKVLRGHARPLGVAATSKRGV